MDHISHFSPNFGVLESFTSLKGSKKSTKDPNGEVT